VGLADSDKEMEMDTMDQEMETEMGKHQGADAPRSLATDLSASKASGPENG
jgi:hypothetical protein